MVDIAEDTKWESGMVLTQMIWNIDGERQGKLMKQSENAIAT